MPTRSWSSSPSSWASRSRDSRVGLGSGRSPSPPGTVDVLLNLGNRYGERAAPGMSLISIRLDPASLARGAPVDLGMVADIRLAAADLIAAIRSMATDTRL